MKLLSLPAGRNGNNQWPLKKTNNQKNFRLKAVPDATGGSHSNVVLCEYAHVEPLTAVHFVAGVLAVDHLVTAAEVGDAASVFALELSWLAQGHCREAQGQILNKVNQKKKKTL